MSSVIRYSAINTKIRALEGKMLTDRQYIELMECKSYKEAILYLKNETFYAEAFKGYDAEKINRGFLEFILKRNCINGFTKLSNYLVGDYKKFLKIFLMRFEIEDLKVIIRGKYIGKRSEKIKEHLIYKGRLNYVDYEKIIDSKSVEEVVQRLKDTPYYNYLSPVVSYVKGEGLFRIEMALDFVYFSSIRKFVDKIPKEDRREIKKIIGIEADLLNLQWIFRGKIYYNLPPEILFNYTIYDGYKLKSSDIKELCYVKDEEQFYEVLNKFKYKNIFIKGENEYLMEKEIIAYLKGVFQKSKRENKLNIGFMLAYIKLMIIEVRNIISIVENKRYNIQNEEALKYVSITY